MSRVPLIAATARVPPAFDPVKARTRWAVPSILLLTLVSVEAAQSAVESHRQPRPRPAAYSGSIPSHSLGEFDSARLSGVVALIARCR